MDDIKKRAEQYAHSYPFAKVADAYEAGALAAFDNFAQWERLDYEPICAGMYLVTITIVADSGLIKGVLDANSRKYGNTKV